MIETIEWNMELWKHVTNDTAAERNAKRHVKRDVKRDVERHVKRI